MSSFFHIVLICNVFRAYLDIFGIFSFSQKVASSLCPVFVLSYLAVGDSYQCSHLTSQQESKQAYFTNVTIYSNALLLVHLCVYTYTCPPRCVTDFFLFDGSIRDIRACQRLRKKRWEPSAFKGQESHVKLPLFTPVTKWTGPETNFLPMRSWAKSNGTAGKREWDTAYFYSVHLLPQPFLPSPLLPCMASL